LGIVRWQGLREHGHQIGSTCTGSSWPAPTVRRAGGEYLARPWGERAVQALYNRLEERYPIVDNFALAGAGLKYGLAADNLPDAGEAAPQLLRYFLSLMSWQQFRMELDGGETEPPTWELAQARAQGASLLVSSLPADDRFTPLAAKAPRRAPAPLDRGVVRRRDRGVVHYRAASRRRGGRSEPFLRFPRGPVVMECPHSGRARLTVRLLLEVARPAVRPI
jgi:hypothetical protein